MKKNILNILFCTTLMFLFACNNNAGGKGQQSGVKNSLLSIASDISGAHLDKDPGKIIVRVHHVELAKLVSQNAAEKLEVSVNVIGDSKLIKLDRSKFVIDNSKLDQDEVQIINVIPLPRYDQDDKLITPGGKVTLELTLNGIKQTQEGSIELEFSRRSLSLTEDPVTIHYAGDTGVKAQLTAMSDDPNERFTVQVDSNDGLNIDGSSIFDMKSGKTVDVTYSIPTTTVGTLYTLSAFVLNDVVATSMHVQAEIKNKPTLRLNFGDEVHDISVANRSVNLVATLINVPAAQTVHIALIGAGGTDVSHWLHLAGADCQPADQGGLDCKVTPAEPKNITLSVNDGITDQQIRHEIINPITVTSTSGTLKSSILTIHNTDYLEEGIEIDGIEAGMKINQGPSETLFTMKLYHVDSSAFKFHLQDASGVDVPGANAMISDTNLQITLASAIDDTKTYKLVATKNSDGSAININGLNSISTAVLRRELDFTMTPNSKHVLSDYSSFYYMNVGNVTGKNLLKKKKIKGLANDAKLVLYADTTTDGCQGLAINQLRIPASGSPSVGDVCTLSSAETTADNACACSLDPDQKIARSCAFKVQLSSAYETVGKTCKINLRVVDSAMQVIVKGEAVVTSVHGLAKIVMQADGNSDQFNNGHRVEMCAINKSDRDADNCILNKSWVTSLTRANIDSGRLYEDGILPAVHANYFDAGTEGGNRFVINNYPGRNIATGASLPRTQLIMGFKDTNNWGDNRCPTGATTASNIGCSGGFTPEGDAFINAGAIKVTPNGLVASGASDAVSIPGVWDNGFYHIGTHTVINVDNNLVRLQLSR